MATAADHIARNIARIIDTPYVDCLDSRRGASRPGTKSPPGYTHVAKHTLYEHIDRPLHRQMAETPSTGTLIPRGAARLYPGHPTLAEGHT